LNFFSVFSDKILSHRRFPIPPMLRSFQFEEFRLQIDERRLLRGTEEVPLAPKVFDTLVLLVQNAGSLVSKEEFFRQLWPDTFVGEDTLAQNISALRRALATNGNHGNGNSLEFISTVPKRGYRFVAPVKMILEDKTSGLSDLQTEPPTQPRSPRVRDRWSVPVATLTAAFAVGVGMWLARPSHPSTTALKQLQLTSNSSENAVVSGVLSPDGWSLAYADHQGLHIKHLGSGDIQTLPQPPDFAGLEVDWGFAPTWPRDNTWLIANASVPGRPSSIWVVPLYGGHPYKIRDNAFAFTLSRDGAWVAFVPPPNQSGFGHRQLWIMRPDGSDAHIAFTADENAAFIGAEWSPDGSRLAYVLFRRKPDSVNIEARSLGGGPPVTLLPSGVTDWSWAPDGRVIYGINQTEPFGDACNFWAIPTDNSRGRPTAPPKQLTNWDGFCLDNISESVDGKRLAFRKYSTQGSIYIAEMQPSRSRVSTPKRLTLNQGKNFPGAWTADSRTIIFSSYLDGRWRIFSQSLDATAPRPLTVKEERNVLSAHLTPDDSAILYTPLPSGAYDPSSLRELWRAPIGGGPPQLVLTAPIYGDPRCTRAPNSLCVFAERTADFKQLIFTSFDPLNGRGSELCRLDTDPGANLEFFDYLWDLSPDGKRIAVLRYSQSQIRILAFDGSPARAVSAKEGAGLQSLTWATDGKGFLVSRASANGSSLLQMDLDGNSKVLLTLEGSVAPWNVPSVQWLGGFSAPWALPSPDGRQIAIYKWELNANMWMMEGF
jgi:DNA-binding winged helix-turn-helix (wHTH) protein/Tol biopolymer transport system component